MVSDTDEESTNKDWYIFGFRTGSSLVEQIQCTGKLEVKLESGEEGKESMWKQWMKLTLKYFMNIGHEEYKGAQSMGN